MRCHRREVNYNSCWAGRFAMCSRLCYLRFVLLAAALVAGARSLGSYTDRAACGRGLIVRRSPLGSSGSSPGGPKHGRRGYRPATATRFGRTGTAPDNRSGLQPGLHILCGSSAAGDVHGAAATARHVPVNHGYADWFAVPPPLRFWRLTHSEACAGVEPMRSDSGGAKEA